MTLEDVAEAAAVCKQPAAEELVRQAREACSARVATAVQIGAVAGMSAEASQQAIEAAGLSFIRGVKVPAQAVPSTRGARTRARSGSRAMPPPGRLS